MRLGVEAAVIGGELVRGDVEVVDGAVVACALHGPSRKGLAVPGFVDLHVNGFGGVDFLTADAAGYGRAGESLLESGVTAFQPTFICAPEEALCAALAELAGAACGPRILGAHLEGPFLSPLRLGMHPVEHRRDPDPALLERLLAAGPVRHVTLAPELAGALELARLLLGRGVVVSLGHSDASAEQARAAFDLGVSTVTHVFNAMRPIRSRDGGLAGAALARPDVTVQMIVDGSHLASETALLVWRAAAGRVALVTDAMEGAGLGDGRYRLGSVEVEMLDGVVRRDGVLAGSSLTMVAAVRNLHALGVPLLDAISAATSVPARVARRADVGVLEPGGPADLVVLDDRLEIVRVLVA
ncbi:MAG: N-acetylglucosamine-6-phosphate deacetylase [Gaiellaceae bacterium]